MGKACKCVYSFLWTCKGEETDCKEAANAKCILPDKSLASCKQGGGDCGGYNQDR